jgi:hypothetical protein
MFSLLNDDAVDDEKYGKVIMMLQYIKLQNSEKWDVKYVPVIN